MQTLRGTSWVLEEAMRDACGSALGPGVIMSGLLMLSPSVMEIGFGESQLKP